MIDFEELELMKVNFLTHCFESAKHDLDRSTVVDGKTFLSSL